MSISDAINNAKQKINNVYNVLEDKGAIMPEVRDLHNMAETVNSLGNANALISGDISSVDTSVSSIRAGAFKNCTNLSRVILHKLVDLSDTSIFEGTPIADKTGYIYVPNNYVGNYRSKGYLAPQGSWNLEGDMEDTLSGLASGSGRYMTGITSLGKVYSVVRSYNSSEYPVYWELLEANLGSYSWQGVAHGDDQFIALGGTGYVSASTNGRTWTPAFQSTNLGSHYWRALAYGNEKFVAIGYTGYISTSEDGTTWTTAVRSTELGSHNWISLIYDGTKFIALGNTGYISTSTNGTTWKPSYQDPILSQDTSVTWDSLTYGNGKFVLVGTSTTKDEGVFMSTSTDGIIWDHPSRIISMEDVAAIGEVNVVYTGVDQGFILTCKNMCYSNFETYNFLPVSELEG